MVAWNFAQVSSIVASSAFETRRSTRAVLHQTGIRNIMETDQYAGARGELGSKEVDLLICDTEIENGDPYELVHSIRHQYCGDNPFVVVVSLVNPNDRSTIIESVNAGADDLVTKPFWAHQLSDRLWGLVQRNRQFMVTDSYIGPVRKKEGQAAGTVNEIDVPNPVQSIGSGVNRKDLLAEIEAAALVISDTKVRADAEHIVSLIRGIVERLQAGETNGTISTRRNRIKDALADIDRRSPSVFQAQSELAQLLQLALVRVTQKLPAHEPRILRALMAIAQAYEIGFKPPEQQNLFG